MSVVDTWDWGKLKITEEHEEESLMCERCNKFEPFENFVIGYDDYYNEEMVMCENCFFDFALHELGFKNVRMNHNGTDYYDPSDDDSEEEWDK